MIRALRWLLASLLLAVPASADVLVVDHRATSVPYSSDHFRQTVLAVLKMYGADFACVPKTVLTTAQCRTGTLPIGNSTRTFDVVVHLNCDMNAPGGTGAAAWNQLTLQSLGWPSVPQVFFGVPTASGNGWTQTTSCSTGVDGYSSAYQAGLNWYTQYMVGTPYVWKAPASHTQVYHLARAGSAGIFREVLRDGPSQASRRLSATSTVNNRACTDCDSTGFAATDSLLLWARYRSSAETVPLIFCASHTGGAGDVALIKMALAMADSVTGGDVFETANVELPKKRALWIKRAFSRGRYDNMNYNNGGGTFCAADSCDSANVKAGIDSLAALNIPFTVGCEVDSMLTALTTYDPELVQQWAEGYPTELAWWARAPLAHYAVETYSGTTNVGSGTTSTGYGLALHDPFGYTRARNMLPRGLTSLPPASPFDQVIATGDSSVYSLLLAARNRMQYFFGSKFCPAIWPAYNDYSPSSDTRAGSQKTQDTLAYVLHHAGFKAVVINPLELTGNVGRTAYNVGSGFVGQAAATAPRGFIPVGRYVNARAPGSTVVLDRIKFLAARSEPDPLNWGFTNAHDIKDEWEQGYLTGDWYPDWPTLGGGAFYYHDFFTRTPIIAFNAQELGGAGQGTTPSRKAYWHVKWINNTMKAVDALMIPGKRLDAWGYADEVEP